jgi:hypothetical protein
MMFPWNIFLNGTSLFLLDLSFAGRVETEESESWNGKLKRKTEIRKWSSQYLAPIATVCACAIRLAFKIPLPGSYVDVYQLDKRGLGYWIRFGWLA